MSGEITPTLRPVVTLDEALARINQDDSDQEDTEPPVKQDLTIDKYKLLTDRIIRALETRYVITIHGIKTIDNVKANVRIYKKSYKAILIEITYAYVAAFKPLQKFWIFAEYSEITQTIKSIGKLKYGRIGQIFKYPENIDKQTIEDEVACLIASEATSSVQLAWDVCCVCHEHTDCETICGHKLCLQCHSQMIVLENDKCPLCRRILPYE